MIVDDLLQALPGKSHVQSDGSQIGGVDPAKYGWEIVPGKRQALLLTTEGPTEAGGYPAWMWYPATPRPILGDSSKLELRMTYVLGGDLRGSNVIETDTRLNGAWNGSVQYNQVSGFQVTDATGAWLDTGISYGPLAVNTEYDVRIAYDFDLPNKLTSVTAIGIGRMLPVPARLQKVPWVGTAWSTGLYLQIQLGSMPSAQPWSLKIKRARYVWS